MDKKIIRGASEHDLLYIMNPKCGWCTKQDPIVDELKKDGHKITILDFNNPNDMKRINEVKAKYNAQCGTPHFIDAKTGNQICGFREKDDLKKWAQGEEVEVPEPPQRPTQKKYKLEYVWIDGNDSVRSKVRYSNIFHLPNEILSVDKVPSWSFDGSSTNQSDTIDSDLLLNPIRLFPNPMESRQTPSWYVFCEVLNVDGTAHESNSRKKLWEALQDNREQNIWVGIEQEYVITNSTTGKPFGWEDYDKEIPPIQGDYYCGVGNDKQKGRMVAEQHALLCTQSNLSYEGFHPEVMLSQWEYQIGPGNPLDIADQLWFSRFLLQRTTERSPHPVSVTYDSKLVDGDWNGSGAHINFSTNYMRNSANLEYMNVICSAFAESHDKAINSYGKDNNKRLTGEHETSSINTFTWGENDRSVSIRIPSSTVTNDGKGYLEDRRPSASMNPYEALTYLVSTISEISEELLVTT